VFDLLYMSELRTSIEGTFESVVVLQNQRTSDPLEIEIVTKACNIQLALENTILQIREIKLTQRYLVKGAITNREPRTTAEGRVLYHNEHDKMHIEASLYIEVSRLLNSASREVFNRFSSIHYLPASRSGLYQALSAFGQIVAELSKSRMFVRRRIELPNISDPLSDYFLKLSTITVETARFSESPLNRVAKHIEDEIMHGKVEFDSKTKRIMFSPNNTSLRLDLSVSSSMVSELSPIVAYLRYVLTEPSRLSSTTKRRQSTLKSMIIIEEPEAHLHPEVQVKLLEKFAELTNLGVKVVITSHSNFIFNKASNLVISRQLSPDRVEATLFIMKERGSIGKPLAIDDYGIDDENFVDTAESLFVEKAEALENNAERN
jgi:predicted ATPase